jgi:diguanylate cyclase (GGDEF)-like protein
MDPLALAVGAAAAVGIGAALQSRRQARQAQAEANRLRQELQAERHAASHDPLTGLPNRRAFYQLGAELVADPARMPLVGVVIDIDGFKKINDTFGHAAGDEVLVTLAGRLIGCVPGNLVARLGGDEFVALLGSAGGDLQWPYLLADRLAASLAEPMLVGGRPLTVTASIGLAPVPGPTLLAEVLHRADRAMYHEKTNRRSQARLVTMLDADGYDPAGPGTLDPAPTCWTEPPTVAPQPARLLADTMRPILAAG